MECSITSDNLTIYANTETLNDAKNDIIKHFKSYMGDKENLPSKQDVEKEINNMYDTVLAIFQNKINTVQLFKDLPLTELGTFRESSTILIKSSKLDELFGDSIYKDYFKEHNVQLRLVIKDKYSAYISLDLFYVDNQQAILG